MLVYDLATRREYGPCLITATNGIQGEEIRFKAGDLEDCNLEESRKVDEGKAGLYLVILD